jgi:hypothetical protein
VPRCDRDAMTMYLPNRDVLPTGYEPAEFLADPELGAGDGPEVGPPDAADEEAETPGS